MNIYNDILKYSPYGEVEKQDKETMLKFIKKFDNYLSRDNVFGHFTASVWVVNEDLDKILLLNHNIYQGFIYPGGHADSEEDLLKVALKELEEETGLKEVIVYDGIFSLECCPVESHVKKGRNISAHIHHNISYLVVIKNENMSNIRALDSENSDVLWFDISNVNSDLLVSNFYPMFINVRDKIFSNKEEIKKYISNI